MTIGPAPMMRIDLMSWRFGMGDIRCLAARKTGQGGRSPAGARIEGVFRLEAAYRQMLLQTEPHKSQNRQRIGTRCANPFAAGRRSGNALLKRVPLVDEVAGIRLAGGYIREF
jgi:hypothetical protein